jgi:DNA-binding transcriptional LysR family regulator
LLRLLPIRAPALVRNIGIVAHAARALSPAAEQFIELLQAQIRAAGSPGAERARRAV